MDDAVKNRASSDEIRSLRQREWYEVDLIDDQISDLVTRRFLGIANKYLLPTPKHDGAWIESDVTGLRQLEPEAIIELRATIRKERKERYEHMLMWVAALTGLIGALSGLIAVIGAS